jgi:hypothetical protein
MTEENFCLITGSYVKDLHAAEIVCDKFKRHLSFPNVLTGMFIPWRGLMIAVF